MARILLIGGLVCLGACIAASVLHFQGSLDLASYRNALAIATVGWFVLATRYATRRRP